MTLREFVDGFTRRDWQTAVEGRRIRFAHVGLGWWTTEQAIPAIEHSEFCESTALVSGSTAKARRVAEENGIGTVLDYDEFAAGDDADAYDAVYVATPNARHLEQVRAAADLGKGVLCEKPMEATVERAERLAAVCADADVPLMIAYRMHTEPAVRRARELVREGVVGEPVTVHGTHSQRLLELNADPEQWRLDGDLTGYGTSMMDLGIYPLNTTRFLLDADPVAVQAFATAHGDAFGDVPDERASAAVLLDSDVHLTIASSQHAHTDSRLVVNGTEGRIELEPAFQLECDLTVSRGGHTVEVETEQVDEMTEEFDYFAHAMLTDGEVTADGEHGLVDMRALAAIYRSAETGERVPVGE